MSIHALLADLKSCSFRRGLQWGRRIHAKVVESGHESNQQVGTALVRMYAKSGSMLDARRVFDRIQNPDLLSWNTLLLGYAENGEGHAALDLFSTKMDYPPDSATYVAALKACTSLALNGNGDGLELGRQIHSKIGQHLDLYVQNTLVDMYTKCRSMVDARRVFDGIQMPDVVSWTTLILGYAENGEGQIALDFFSKMKARGCAPNPVTYVAVLKACRSLAVNGEDNGKAEALRTGRGIHAEIGDRLDAFVQSTLIDMYSKCGSMVDACSVFDSVQKPNVVSWNTLLLGYAENGEGVVALKLFSKMKCAPNSGTYAAVLKACASLAEKGEKEKAMQMGKEIHAKIGSHLNPHLQSTLVDMYAKCGSMVDARQVFDSIQKPDGVAWGALLLGYAENGEGHTALELFFNMKAAGQCEPNAVVYLAALKSCTSLATNGDVSDGLELGREIHSEIGDRLTFHVQNTLIDMYSKCGSMAEAREVFDSIRKPNMVSWTALLLGYAENGEDHIALDLLSKMKAEGCVADSVTYVAALKACGSIGALALGRKFHAEIKDFCARVVTCLVDFYAKCGSLAEARAVFDQHSTARDTTTWNALLAGYSSCGDTSEVFSLFEMMQDTGSRPDGVTFVSMLLCCNHAGLVRKAMQYLEAMPVQYGITPSVFHYNCMVDVLGRANQLTEALSVLRRMPCHPNTVTYSALLGACRKWKNVEIGKMVFQSLVDMDKKDTSGYILMAHIYSSRGMQEEHDRVLECRTIDARKLQGEAYVTDELGKMVTFEAGQEGPPEVEEKLTHLLQHTKEPGYVVESRSTAADGGALCGHTERRAVVYGILRTPPEEPVRAFKNTRMCGECHELTKMFSKLTGRTIMVRDASRFHVMVNGTCSCGDYF